MQATSFMSDVACWFFTILNNALMCFVKKRIKNIRV